MIKTALKIVLFVFSVIIFNLKLNAQTGSIEGIIRDKNTKESIIGANVIIQGTSIGSSTDFDGKYDITGLKSGTYIIEVSYISYKKQIINNVKVVAEQKTVLNIDLETESKLLKSVEVKAEIARDKENVLMMEQKKATAIVQQIGQQELSRKGVSDVAAAVTKVTGISKQQGDNNIYVRGLGDRYNSTSINGLPMPSNNPELKNISLDIFSTDIVEFISIDKVYNNNIYGDFAGGNIDIASKDFSGKGFIEAGLSTKYNTNLSGKTPFILKEGPDFFGFYTTQYPPSIAEFTFENKMNPKESKYLPIGFSLTGGNKYKIGKKDSEFNFFATANFDNEYSYIKGISRSVNSTGYALKDLNKEKHSYGTNSTLMLNVGYKLKKKHKLNYNLIFINSTDNTFDKYEGTIIDIADYNNGLLIRNTYKKNTILINQLIGSHEIGYNTTSKWGVSYNSVTSDIPDRMQNTFVKQNDNTYIFGQNQITDNHRYYHYLKEDEFAFNASITYKLFSLSSETDFKYKFTLGGTARMKIRDFNATQYNFRILNAQSTTVVDPNNLDAFFNNENLLKGNYFRIETFRGNFQVKNATDPQVYSGNQIIQVGYFNIEYKPTLKFTALLGFRAESVYQKVEWNTQLDPNDKKDILEDIALLPSLTAKYEINSKNNLRFGTSKTYTLPQFKERALFIYEDVTQVKIGNPDLYQSDNYNVDLKWELFPKNGQLISLGLFGKYILNPINEVTISSATNDISFLNTGDWGYVSGAELEIKLDLYTNNEKGYKFNFGFNTSYMNTNQELNSEKVQEETVYKVNFTNKESAFTGASDLLINSDLGYVKNWNNEKNNISITLSYNYTSEKLFAIGTNNRGDIFEKPISTLDFIVKTKLNKLNIGFSVKNILDSKVETYQANKTEDIVVSSYKRGLMAGISLSYKF